MKYEKLQVWIPLGEVAGGPGGAEAAAEGGPGGAEAAAPAQET